MSLLAEKFTEEELERRPFAVETGYEEWGEQATHLLIEAEVVLGVEPLSKTREIVDEKKLRTGVIMAMDACRATCEVGYRTREQQEVTMPSPSVLATAALGDSYKNFYEELLLSAGGRDFQEINENNFEANLRLVSLIPLVAESAYIWGRHGDYFDWPELLPKIVRDSSSRVTIRAHALEFEKESSALDDVQEALRNFEPYQPSLIERVRSRLSEKSWEEVQVKRGVSEKRPRELIDEATQLLLVTD